MSSASPHSETLTLDSTSLYFKAYADLFSQPPSLPHPLPPIPSSLPQPKLIPRTRFVVDGFKHAGDFSVSYFLSHFHSDHYCGLTPSWSRGVIYCSSITARLLVEVLKVSAHLVVQLPLCEPILIDGCEVFLIDANHCPGAVQFLFRFSVSEVKAEKYVHTGDFRYCDSMKSLPVLNEFIGANAVFLDTTYCDPKFIFPSQEESINYVVEVIQRNGVANEGGMKNVLFLVATYVIGKEKILLEISRSCKKKIHVDDRKLGVLRVLGLGEGGVFTEDENESDVHVVGWNVLGETWPYFRPNFVRMKEIMEERGYSKVIGFVPTGWTYEAKKNTFPVRMKDSFEIHLVPYSEHSNYDELREYVKLLKPKCVIPTVGTDIDKLDSKQANALCKHFAAFLDVTAIKQEFLMSFKCGAKEEDENANTSYSLDSNVIIKDQNEEGLYEIEYSKDMNMDNIEESIQELRDSLPSWVTRDLMLDLLRKSGNNVVDAVSEFYEHELEFHEQITANISPTSESPAGSKFKSSLFTETSLFKTEDGPSCQNFKLPGIRSPIKSLGKKKRTPQCKTNKKSKTSRSQEVKGPNQHAITNYFNKLTPLESKGDEVNGSKQYTITKFFNKVTPLESKADEANASSTHSQDDDNLVQDDITEQDKVDHFIEIVNGDESLRSHALSILERGKGDINVALDIYYSNSSLTVSDKKVSLADCNLSQTESLIQNNSSNQGTKLVEKRVSDSGMPSPVQQRENLLMDYVLLPPEKYSPSEHACWRKGQPAPYLHLARTFEHVEKERGKIKATLMICNMFRSLLALSPEDVLPAVYLCVNKIAPDHMNMELNIGGSIVVAALEDACGTNKFKTRDLYNCLGDLGDVAQRFRPIKPLFGTPAVLTIRGVFSALRKISAETGNGSILRKKNIIVNLMQSCREKELKFLVRTLVRNLRIGAMMRTILPGLAQAIVMNSAEGSVETLKEHLRRLSAAVIEAYNVLPNLDVLVPSLMEKGVMFSSTSVSMVPGLPIKPMLAKIINGAAQVLSLFQKKAFTCEYKYDGQRAQIHRLDDGSVRVFSRNGDETTARFPDLVEIIKEACVSVVGTFILDAEVVAINRKKGLKLMSFQELSSREKGSKGSALAVDKIKVDICVFVFDVMFVNGKQLLDLPLRQRRKYLKDLFGQEKPGYFEYAKEITVESDDDACPNNEAMLAKINGFLNDAHLSSCEGIMVKLLDFKAGYSPSKRSDAWLKVKRDYVEGLGDSLDLVPIGAWHGNGRKAGWYSPFLMACYNPDTEEFQSVCRVMSGFSDSFYKEMKEFFSEDKVLMKKPPYYATAEVPDMWFSPELVWEIRGADFTISPVHHAAIGVVHPSRGISVRFPRFVRSVSDRNPEECSTAADIAEMFSSQTRKMEVDTED